MARSQNSFWRAVSAHRRLSQQNRPEAEVPRRQRFGSDRVESGHGDETVNVSLLTVTQAGQLGVFCLQPPQFLAEYWPGA